MNKRKKWIKRSLKASSFFIILLLAIYIIPNLSPNVDNYTGLISDYIQDKGAIGIAYYLGFASLALCFALPRQITSFVAGYAFGAYTGWLWGTLASLFSCILVFGYSRFLAKDYIQKKFGRKIAKIDDLLCSKPFSTTLIIRLLPVGNNLISCMIAGVSKMPAISFFSASFIGYIPQNFIFSLLGSGINVSSFTQTIVSIVLFVLSSILGVYLYTRNRNIAEVAEDEEEA